MLDIITPAIAARFWSKVDQSGGPDACWPWLGGRKSAGYGNFFVRRETPGRFGRMIFMNAHKLAYLLVNGPLADGHVVRHTCDSPPCCNPAHLIPGSDADNVQDAIERGRFDPLVNYQKALPALHAANITRRRLTEQDIAAIVVARARGRSLTSIAADYGLTDGSLCNIFRGKSYCDLPLAQRLATLYRQGIRFPYYRGRHTPDTIHPDLRALATELY